MLITQLLAMPENGHKSGTFLMSWPDATGTWYEFKMWGQNLEYAFDRAEESAKRWATYTHDPIAAQEMIDQIMEDGKRWGFD
jgi:hypothetical protein